MMNKWKSLQLFLLFFLMNGNSISGQLKSTSNQVEIKIEASGGDYPPGQGNPGSISPSPRALPLKLFSKEGNDLSGFTQILQDRSNKKPPRGEGALIVHSSHYELEYILGRKIIFICLAHGRPRPTITWHKDGLEVYAHNYFQVREWPVGKHKLQSKMEIDPATPMDVANYECRAINEFGVDHKDFRAKYDEASNLKP